MVRTAAKPNEDEKKETRKKKSTPKPKKISESGVWPCKINGCNKQFAREADLKRHQRTTKSHSMPGFQCPQCEATFTRTDALRRHQKSRHNGVIIEPVDVPKSKDDEDEDEIGSSGSKSASRSASPASKAKGKGKKSASEGPTALANPGTAGPSSGPSSHYRQHTMQNGVLVDASQYTQQGLGIPTSATRAGPPSSSWPPPPPWAAEGQPQMGTISYHPNTGQPGSYQSSSYYREPPPSSNGQSMQGSFPAVPFEMQNTILPNASVTQEQHLSRRGTPIASNPHGEGDVEMQNEIGGQGSEVLSSMPVIDPSLDASVSMSPPNGHTMRAPNSQGSSSKPVSLEITQAAMEAVMHSNHHNRASGTPDRATSINTSSTNGLVVGQGLNGTNGLTSNGMMGMGSGIFGSPDGQISPPAPPKPTTGKSPFAHTPQPPPQPIMLSQSLTRPHPMDSLPTDTSSHMLNPADLLNQANSSNSDNFGAILDMLLQHDPS